MEAATLVEILSVEINRRLDIVARIQEENSARIVELKAMRPMTDAARQWLASVEAALVPDNYRRLLALAWDVAEECGCVILDKTHCEAAVARMGG